MLNNEEQKYLRIENSEENRILFQSQDKCDKYDYLAAVGCGAIGGIIDIFLVGSPQDTTLGKWTDEQVDKSVMTFAKHMGWNPRIGQENNIKSAIGFLERNFKVNYDQSLSSDVSNLFKMNPRNHHMMSIAHSPDIIGLFFSILNQFTSTSSFIANGQLITISTDTFELKGNNFISKIFCGVVNWFAHVMSDISGSSGSSGRGSGVVMPFYELFGFCKFGNFSDDKNNKKDLAEIATSAFEQGYDFRFGLAQSIPVIITDLLIRFIWSLRKYFQYKKSIKECIPTQKHADLRIMLILGHGTLCAMDGIDAGIRAKGNHLLLFMRLNMVAWLRFVTLVLKEVLIRVGIVDPLQKYIEAYKRINEALLLYLKELEKIDIELFKKETEEYNKLVYNFENIKTNDELNILLLDIFDQNGYQKPWQGDFEEHMSNKNAMLVFE